MRYRGSVFLPHMWRWLLLGWLGLMGCGSAWAQVFGLRAGGVERIRVYEDGDRDGQSSGGYASARVRYGLDLQTGRWRVERVLGVTDLDGGVEAIGAARPLFPVALDGAGGTERLRYRVLWPGVGERPVRAWIGPFEGESRSSGLFWEVDSDWYGAVLLVIEVRDTVLGAVVRMETLLEVICTEDGPPRTPLLVVPENSPGVEFWLDGARYPDPDGPHQWLPWAEGIAVGSELVLLPRTVAGEDPFVGVSTEGGSAGLYWDGVRGRLRVVPGALRAHTGPPERGVSLLRVGYRNACPPETLWAELRVRIEGVNEPPRVSDARPGPADWTGKRYAVYDNRPSAFLGPNALNAGQQELVWDLIDGRNSSPLLRPGGARAGPNGPGEGWNLFYDVETPPELLRYRFRVERRQRGLRVGVTSWVERYEEAGLSIQLVEGRLHLRLGEGFHTDFDRDGILDTLVLVVRAEDDGRSNGRAGLRGGVRLSLEEASYSAPESAEYGWMLQVRARGAPVGRDPEPDPLRRSWFLRQGEDGCWVVLEGAWSGPVRVMLYDLLGRRIWSGQISWSHEGMRIRIPLEGLASGLYWVVLPEAGHPAMRPLRFWRP